MGRLPFRLIPWFLSASPWARVTGHDLEQGQRKNGKWKISQKLWEIETCFVLWTHRKSYMGFPLVMWPLTSDAPNDPQTPNIYFSQKICEIETSFVLLIYRKSCMGFPLVTWPLTSDAPNDPQTPNIYFSQKICEIETSFVLLIYRKSCMGFPLVMWPLT